MKSGLSILIACAFLILSPGDVHAVIDRPFDLLLDKIDPNISYQTAINKAANSKNVIELENFLRKAKRIAASPNWIERMFDTGDSGFTNVNSEDYYICAQIALREKALGNGIIARSLDEVERLVISIRTKAADFGGSIKDIATEFIEDLNNNDLDKAQELSRLLNGYFQNQDNELYYFVIGFDRYLENLNLYLDSAKDLNICDGELLESTPYSRLEEVRISLKSKLDVED